MLLKLKLTPAIYLVGFMGSGKSSVGRALAEELGWSFFDLDDDVEKAAGQTIAAMVDGRGEPAFRTLERQVLVRRVESAQAGRPQVIALGGGTFTFEENYSLTSSSGVTIWLDTPLDVIEARIAAETHRPLARDAQAFRELYETRRGAYARADYRIETGALAHAEVVARILALPIFVP